MGRHPLLGLHDRALLQGFTEPLEWPDTVTETKRKELVAQCVIPGFARVLSEAAFKYQLAVHKAAQAVEALRRLEKMSDAETMAVYELVWGVELEASGEAGDGRGYTIDRKARRTLFCRRVVSNVHCPKTSFAPPSTPRPQHCSHDFTAKTPRW